MAALPHPQAFPGGAWNAGLAYHASMGSDGLSPEPKLESTEEAGTMALLVRHLPEAIPSDALSRLFSHYGAVSCRPCSFGRLKNCAFVEFKNQDLAYQAQRQLNGLKFLGKVLSVEIANRLREEAKRRDNDAQSTNVSVTSALRKNAGSADKDAGDPLKPGCAISGQPIAPKLGIDYPFPPLLEYAYPPPDGNILANIVNALIAVPRFYTQVLHLMNKMNIPPPFRMALPTPPLPPSDPAPTLPSPVLSADAELKTADISSDESEMESDEDVNCNTSSQGTSSGIKPRRKRKREAIVGPGVDRDVAHEAVGLKPVTLVPNEIPIIKKKKSVLQIKIVPKVVQSGSDDTLKEEYFEPDNENSAHTPYATPEEIQSKRLAPEEILSLPKFKNYTVGDPASVLYIKNLDKSVVLEDFFYIFGSLFGSFDAAKASLNVKLMQEGRMRGQAFLTFPSVDLAHQALNLVNGYVFKEKPMIIQFGRNLSGAKANGEGLS